MSGYVIKADDYQSFINAVDKFDIERRKSPNLTNTIDLTLSPLQPDLIIPIQNILVGINPIAISIITDSVPLAEQIVAPFLSGNSSFKTEQVTINGIAYLRSDTIEPVIFSTRPNVSSDVSPSRSTDHYNSKVANRL